MKQIAFEIKEEIKKEKLTNLKKKLNDSGIKFKEFITIK